MVSLLGLRTLTAVVETGGIRAAALRVGRTPSAVSMTLKQLEGEIGAPLFEGDRKSLLSDLGARVHGEAKALLDHYDRASAAIAALAADRMGRCDVAAVPSVAANFLPEAIARVRDRVGSFRIQVRDTDSQAVIAAVEDGSVEIGICVLACPRPRLLFEPLFSEPLDLVCRRDHPFARRDAAIAWDEIEGGTFILNGSAATIGSPAALATMERSCLQARTVTSLLAMVGAGLGVTVLPRLCRRQSGPEIAFVPLADAGARRTVGWIRTAERSLLPATRHLVAALEEAVARHAAALDCVPAKAATTTGEPGAGRRAAGRSSDNMG